MSYIVNSYPLIRIGIGLFMVMNVDSTLSTMWIGYMVKYPIAKYTKKDDLNQLFHFFPYAFTGICGGFNIIIGISDILSTTTKK